MRAHISSLNFQRSISRRLVIFGRDAYSHWFSVFSPTWLLIFNSAPCFVVSARRFRACHQSIIPLVLGGQLARLAVCILEPKRLGAGHRLKGREGVEVKMGWMYNNFSCGYKMQTLGM